VIKALRAPTDVPTAATVADFPFPLFLLDIKAAALKACGT